MDRFELFSQSKIEARQIFSFLREMTSQLKPTSPLCIQLLMPFLTDRTLKSNRTLCRLGGRQEEGNLFHLSTCGGETTKVCFLVRRCLIESKLKSGVGCCASKSSHVLCVRWKCRSCRPLRNICHLGDRRTCLQSQNSWQSAGQNWKYIFSPTCSPRCGQWSSW